MLLCSVGGPVSFLLIQSLLQLPVRLGFRCTVAACALTDSVLRASRHRLINHQACLVAGHCTARLLLGWRHAAHPAHACRRRASAAILLLPQLAVVAALSIMARAAWARPSSIVVLLLLRRWQLHVRQRRSASSSCSCICQCCSTQLCCSRLLLLLRAELMLLLLLPCRAGASCTHAAAAACHRRRALLCKQPSSCSRCCRLRQWREVDSRRAVVCAGRVHASIQPFSTGRARRLHVLLRVAIRPVAALPRWR